MKTVNSFEHISPSGKNWGVIETTPPTLHPPPLCYNLLYNVRHLQFRPPIALRTDLSHITMALWEIPVLRMAH